jgi:hypothetical protein
MPLKPAFVTSLATAALALLAFPAIAQAELPLPAEPQPAEAELQPGLAVRYYAEFFRHIDQLIDWQEYEDGKEGPPLPNLDYRTGTGRVLTSERSDGTGAEITGFIKLDKAGGYTFNFRSNDGVRMWLGGVEILDDPDVHADRFSDLAEVEIFTPGWYPIKILYFERKNTSTLELYWLTPGDDGSLAIVPKEVFAHLPG